MFLVASIRNRFQKRRCHQPLEIRFRILSARHFKTFGGKGRACETSLLKFLARIVGPCARSAVARLAAAAAAVGAAAKSETAPEIE